MDDRAANIVSFLQENKRSLKTPPLIFLTGQRAWIFLCSMATGKPSWASVLAVPTFFPSSVLCGSESPGGGEEARGGPNDKVFFQEP